MADIQSNINVNIDTSEALASIKALQRQISAFYTSMARSGAAANAAVSNMQSNLINTINQTGKFSATIKTITSTTEAFTTSLEKNKFSLGEYFRYAGGASKTFGKNFKTEMETIDKVARERVKTLQTQYITMGREANGALKAIAVRPLTLDLKDLGTQTAIAAQKQQILNQLLKQGSTNLLNFGKNTQWAGRQLMVGFTIPLSMVGTAAAKTFMKMEEQAIKFKRVYGDSMTPAAEADAMVKQIRDLASEFTKYGVAAEKTMELAATAAAAGKQGLELTAQVREANRLAVLGQVEQQEALNTTISITNAFGTAADQLAKKINFLNAVENQTVTSIEDLTIAVPKAGPVVKQLGGDVEDLAFFLTAMKEGGINASEGANALKSGLASLINPTDKASAMLAGFGINIDNIVQSNKGNVKGIVIDFAKALDTLDPLNRARAIEQLFGKFQFSRLSTLFQNVIKDGSQASRVLDLTSQSSSQLAALASKELGTVAASSMYKFQKAVEDLKVALAPIGEIFLKLVTPVIEFGTKILENFNKLDSGAKNFITGLVAVVGGLGPVLIMTFGLLANGVANIIKGFMLVRNIFSKSGQSAQFLGDETEYMTQQQLEAAGVASSLEQVHQRLEQRFTSEAVAVNALSQALERAVRAQQAFQGTNTGTRPAMPKKYAKGVVSVPGPKGAGDIIPAMLAPGEAVVPAKQATKYAALIQGIVADNIPGFENSNIQRVKTSNRSTITFGDMDIPVSGSQAQQRQILSLIENAVGSVMSKLGVDIQPRLQDILSREENVTADRLKQIFAEFDGNLIRHAEALTEVGSVELTHGIAPVTVQPETIREMGAKFSRINPNATHRTMANETQPRLFHSEQVFGLPKASNQQQLLMSGIENSQFIRQFPETVMAHLADFGGLDANDPGLRDFAMKMADRLEQAGTRAITESDFYEIVSKTLGDDIDKTAREVIQRAGQTLRTGQWANEGSSKTRRQAIGQLPRGVDRGLANPEFIDENGNIFGGGTAYTKKRGKMRQFDAQAFGFTKSMLQERARQAGLVVGTAMESGASQGLNEIIKRNSPPKEALKIGRDYGFALNSALAEYVPKVKVAGEAFGLAATTSMTTVSPAMMQHLRESAGRVVRPYLDAQGRLIPIASQKIQILDREAIAARDAAIAQESYIQGLERVAAETTSMSQSLAVLRPGDPGFIGPLRPGDPGFAARGYETQAVPKTTGSLEKFGATVRNTSFVLTSLAAAGTMSGGVIGDISNNIMKFSGLIFAATTVIDLMTAAERRRTIATNAATIAEGNQAKTGILGTLSNFLMGSRGKASGLGFMETFRKSAVPVAAAFKQAGKGASGFAAGIKAVGTNLLVFGRTLLAFIPVAGWIAIGATALYVGIGLIQQANERVRKETQGMADAIRMTAGKINSAGEVLNKEKFVSSFETVGTGVSPTATQESLSMTQRFLEDEEFLNQFKSTTDDMATATQRDLQTIQNAVGLQFASMGWSEEEVTSLVAALQTVAKRTDVKFDFKSIDISGKDPKNFKTLVSDITKKATDAFSQPETKQTKNTILGSAQALQQAFYNLNDAVKTGQIDVAGYNERIEILRNTIAQSANATDLADQMLLSFAANLDASGEAGKQAFAKILTTREISNFSDQLFVMQVISSGAIANAEELGKAINYLNIIAKSAAGDKTIGAALLAEANAYISGLKSKVAEIAGTNAKLFQETQNQGEKTKSAYQTAMEQLSKNIKEINQATTAYNRLSKAGMSASDAFRTAKDPVLATALATTKVGTAKWKELVLLTKQYAAALKTSKLNEVLANLKIDNETMSKFGNLSKYLSQMGLSGEEIQSVLQDQELAESLMYATGEGAKGFAKIKEYIAYILKNKELKISILPLEDQFKERMQKVSTWFSNEKNALEIQLKIDTKADKDIVRLAQQQIDTLNFQADDFEAGLTRLENQEEAINEKYDNRIEALDKVIAANDRIAEQNKEELNIFQMVARGDISGAAAGIAQLQQQKAKNALEAKKESLEAQRKNELESLTTEVMVNGQRVMLTRNDIEENLKNIKQQIFEIEEKTLEPAQRRIDILTATKDNQEASLKVLELTEDEWLKIENNIELSKTRTTEYLGELEKALAVAKQIPGALAGTSRSGDIVGQQDPVKETDFGKNENLGNPKNINPNPGPQNPKDPGKPPVDPQETALANRKTELELRKYRYGLYGLGEIPAPRRREIEDYQDEVKKLRDNNFLTEWERNDNARNIKRYEEKYGIIDIKSKKRWDNPSVPYLYPYATGGYISGPGTGTSDSIPALVSNGEYVIRASAVKAIGTDTLDRMNYADKNKFADGGYVNTTNLEGIRNASKNKSGTSTNRVGNTASVWRPGSVYIDPNNPMSAIGAGLNFVMNSLYEGIFGKWAVETKQGKPTLPDLEDTGTMLSNIVPIPGLRGLKAGSAAAKVFAKTGSVASSKAAYTSKIAEIITGKTIKQAERLAAKANTSSIASMTDEGLDSLISSIYTKTDSIVDSARDGVSSVSIPTYSIGDSANAFAFVGRGQDTTDFSKLGAKIVEASPEGILNAALSINPKNKVAQSMLTNFQNNKIGKKELSLLDTMYASVAISNRGLVNRIENTNGFAEVLAALNGNKNAKNLLSFKNQELQKAINGKIAQGMKERLQFAQASGLGVEDFTSPKNVAVIHSTKFPVNRNADNSIDLFANADKTGKYLPGYSRNSIHFTLEDVVKSHLAGTWPVSNKKIVTSLASMLDENGLPYNLLPIDTWWMRNPGQPLKLSNTSVIRPFENIQSYKEELIRRGLYGKDSANKTLPILTVDPNTKDVLHYIKDATPSKKTVEGIINRQIASGNLTGIDAKNMYTALDRRRIQNAAKQYGIHMVVEKGNEARVLEQLSLQVAKQQLGINTSAYTLGEHSLNNTVREQQIRGIASLLNVQHQAHTGSFPEILEKPVGDKRDFGAMGLSTMIGDSIEAIRGSVFRGKFITSIKEIMKNNVPEWANGGLVKPKYFSNGDLAKGTDIIPAMLTPGEFVMTKHAVEDYGINNLRAINSGATPGNSVYNGYNISVNVRSNSNPDQIANAVMTQIRQINAQQVRGNRF